MARTPRTPRTPRAARVPRTPGNPRTPRTPRDNVTAESESAAVAMEGTEFSGNPSNPSEVIPIPDDINQGLSSAKQSTMKQILGVPRDVIDQECRLVRNEPTRSLLVTKNVGPFRVTGLKPAVASLKRVLAEIKVAHRDIFDVLDTAGMLCCRRVRNGTNFSNHSWGCAVDIRVAGILDGLGNTRHDGKTLAGLAAMAPFFNEAGWFWGVGFSSFEDGMHFEIADETIRDWHANGKLGSDVSDRTTTPSNLSIGDRGAEVRRLQEVLAKLGFDILPDGDFGPITHGIVIDFQARSGLTPDGIVGPQTKQALGLD